MRRMIGSVLTQIYKMLVRLSQASYRFFPFRIKKVNARVISVGNITWGGTGKTPLVICLAKRLAAEGRRVAVLTRGYGKDEQELLKKSLPNIPVIVGRDRVRAARKTIKQDKVEFIVLDDGFQHIRLHRDLDVVNINATQPFGPGGLIPMGTLREPLENLSRADIFILTKANIGAKNIHWIRQRLAMIKPNAVIFEARHRPVRISDWRRNLFSPLDTLKGKKVAVISAIGDPHSFEKTVENQGAEIAFAARFGDHHAYSSTELVNFAARCKALSLRDVVTTEKDFQNIRPLIEGRRPRQLQDVNFLVLEIEFELDDEEDFVRRCIHP